MNYVVYKHTFPNGKVYIGVTSANPEKRWNNGHGYLTKRNDGKYSQSNIANAIIKYGWKNISHEILFSGLTKHEALHIEAQLISEYKSNKKEYGYNIKDYSSKMIRCIETGHVYPTISVATKETGCTRISACLSGAQKTSGGYHWKYVD